MKRKKIHIKRTLTFSQDIKTQIEESFFSSYRNPCFGQGNYNKTPLHPTILHIQNQHNTHTHTQNHIYVCVEYLGKIKCPYYTKQNHHELGRSLYKIICPTQKMNDSK